MIRFLGRFLVILFIILILILTYLSIFGITTDKFNSKIQNQILNIDQRIRLDLKPIKLLLSPLDLKVKIKTFGPTIILEKKKISLESIKSKISLKSYLVNSFLINDIEISTKTIKAKDLISFLKSYKNSKELFILEKIVEGGYLNANIFLHFDEKGLIKKNYIFKGQARAGKINFFNKNKIKNINFDFNIKDKFYEFNNINISLDEIDLNSSLIVKKDKNEFFVNGIFTNDIKKLTQNKKDGLIAKYLKNLKIEEIIFNSKNNFSFKMNEKFQVKNLNIDSQVKLDKLKYSNKLSFLKDYFTDLKDTINLNKHTIKINLQDEKLNISGAGLFSFENYSDKISYSVNKIQGDHNFKIIFDIIKNPLLIEFFEYKKKKNLKAKLILEGDYNKNKKTNFKLISLKENQNKIIIKDLSLNKNFKFLKMNKMELDLINQSQLKNQINITKEKKNYKLKGKSFDASQVIENILNSDNNDGFSSIFNDISSIINLNIDEVFIDKVTSVENLKAKVVLKNNEIKKIDLKSFFSPTKKLTFSVNTQDGQKITTLYTDNAKSLVKRYKFIKGFEDGSLDFYSIKKDNISNATLKIYDFRLKELPILTKILTLASLQGIADLLSGDGIRFDEFEMLFNNKGNLMSIDEVYAIGPAISLLMDGYVEKNKLISLRGTLVPATTLNKAIGSIPLLGNILVGKKTGEGVFGVSFKIKGPPGKLETTVNPIKTLTPRFITRTLEKFKKN